MLAFSPLTLLLLASALLFLGTAAHLVINADAIARLFRRSAPRHAAPHGELVPDPHGRGLRAPRGVILASLALHLLGLAGMVAATLLMSAAIAPA